MDLPAPKRAPQGAADRDADPAGAQRDRYAQARHHMVDGQVRPNKVTDARVIEAMRRLPRERFLPPGLAGLAYVDGHVALGDDRALMEPMVIARLVQLARARPGERALVVGAGTGYGAALLASCGAEVVALEEDERLLAIAHAVLPGTAPGVRIVAGPLAAGLADGAPWDIVLIEGAVQSIPPAIAAQVRQDHGRLVTVLAKHAGAGIGVVAVPGAAGAVLRPQPEFDCATPLLPALLPARGFVF